MVDHHVVWVLQCYEVYRNSKLIFSHNSTVFYLGGRQPFRGGYGYEGGFPSHGPRIFRSRGAPMMGGPMGPFPGPMGPPFGKYFVSYSA